MLDIIVPKREALQISHFKSKKKQVSAQVKWTYCAELLVLSQVDGKKYSLENKKFNYNKKNIQMEQKKETNKNWKRL